MSNFQIITDTSCDRTPQQLEEMGVKYFPITLTIGNKTYPDQKGYFPDVDEFYALQAKNNRTTTGCESPLVIIEAFESILKTGRDILYIGIDYELSEGVMNGVYNAKRVLSEKYPDRRIEIPETHSIAVGLGLLLTRMVEYCRGGTTMDEALVELERLSKITAHWFTVSNYDQLKHSGRVNPAVSMLATMLNIKPVMALPYNGNLMRYSTVRGNNKILRVFAEEVAKTVEDADRRVWISYGANSERARAEQFAGMIDAVLADKGLPPVEISYHRIGPIIGAHTGPTVLAVFFFADKRV